MACWERWECDFAVEHKHRELKPPRTFAPKFGGLWLMRRKHWFELWGQIRRSRGTAQIPLWCIFGLQVTRNWKPEAKLEPKLFSFQGKNSRWACPRGGMLSWIWWNSFWAFLDPGNLRRGRKRCCADETWWTQKATTLSSLIEKTFLLINGISNISRWGKWKLKMVINSKSSLKIIVLLGRLGLFPKDFWSLNTHTF